MSESKADIKAITLGSAGVGKTCIVKQYTKKVFDTTKSTIGVGFELTKVNNRTIAIWDTAGEERFHALTNLYCRNTNAAILVYDITDANSFRAIKSIYYDKIPDDGKCLKILVGTKLDLVQADENKRAISLKEAHEFADLKNIPFFEVSAKANINIDCIFIKIAEQANLQPDVRNAGTKHLPKSNNTSNANSVNLEPTSTTNAPQKPCSSASCQKS